MPTAHEFLTDQGCYTHSRGGHDEYDVYEGDSHNIILHHGILVVIEPIGLSSDWSCELKQWAR